MNILKKHRTLAKNSILTEYDEKKRRRLDRQEGYEDGKLEGYEDGRMEGIEIGRNEGVEIGRNEGVEIGRNEGRIEGIRFFIQDHLEDGTPENRIIEKLIFRFHLDPDEAKEYVKKCKE